MEDRLFLGMINHLPRWHEESEFGLPGYRNEEPMRLGDRESQALNESRLRSSMYKRTVYIQ